ncbi:GreA/GreB family elongation factor [Candidatus Roizmanbacteria bacterium]|nr:GreA/GreB family elongation factor [Candidatus Roizmanbacteria bacterium]
MKPKNAITQEGFNRLLSSEKELLKTRGVAVGLLAEYRAMGDLSENAAYRSARWKLSSIDSQLRRLKHQIATSEVAKRPSNEIAGIGSTVGVESEGKTYTYFLVGTYEADPLKNEITDRSPLGRNLFGKKPGDKISVLTPGGVKEFRIISVH